MKPRRRYKTLLKKIYEDPKHPASFSSPHALYAAAKKLQPSITYQEVYDWLCSKEAYTKYRRARVRFDRRKIICAGIDYQWQADLISYFPLARENNNFRYLLSIVDCFSRFGIVLGMKNKQGSTCREAFVRAMKLMGRRPKKLQTDQGTEFYNETFRSMLKEHKIHLFSTKTEIKASICERFNRTVREKVAKYMINNKTLRYIDALPDILIGYNSRQRRVLGGLSPSEVTKSNEQEVYNAQYRDYLDSRTPRHTFQIGDIVRIAKYRKKFKKSFDPNFSDTLYLVADKLNTKPATYRLQHRETLEVVEGPFYESELQKVTVEEP